MERSEKNKIFSTKSETQERNGIKMTMKFVKGLLIGGLITTGVMMMWPDNNMDTQKIAKKGKRWAKKMGIMQLGEVL